ncbi:PPC domain-containing DNA-binding protein [Azospirillum picis]|uniref:DNA-binding protein with PD1-like motif n=1 Tax=Azospirillum picis TaxID=488438 RepID=A0ABU0MNP3_9PROT|nr:PPC domain-containing DNA-binding protein [Azospirillum picis]MBP2303545.1 putative DNA-binding protein with PD1-like motif [Azospirillum picis]MDQ0534949.1 putative DNA-binding protein with PD1-like motif [Azospirillum picis]
MQVKRIKEGGADGGQRVFAVVFQTGDDPIAGLKAVARDEGLAASSLTAIGAFRRGVLGFFDFDRKDYHRIPVEEQCEVVSLIGNVTAGPDGPGLHLHAVLGRRDGQAVAGHLLEAEVHPTLEVMLTESPAHLVRRKDAETGLPLLAPSDPEAPDPKAAS